MSSTRPGSPERPAAEALSAARILVMTRAQNTIIWGLALVVGAFVLGQGGENALPWAVATVGVVALLGGLLVILNERDAAQLAAREAAREPTDSGQL